MAADQEYRSEQSMPMLAKILSKHHGFDCTVLFAVNEKGEVDPTMPVYPEKGKPFHEHHIPGLELLAKADLVLFFPRLLTLPMKERELIVDYIDSGRPILSLRTGNHGFHGALPYKINGKQVMEGDLPLECPPIALESGPQAIFCHFKGAEKGTSKKLTNFYQVPARSNIACSSTLHPAVMCSGLASSISLWLMPSLQGMKIMPLEASLAI